MFIYKIENLEKLLPKYSNHGIVLSISHPTVQYEDENYQPNTQPNLGYHMFPEQVPGTYSKYFREKLNFPEILSKRTIKLGNDTANSGSAESISIEHVFHIDKLPWGIVKDPLDPRKLLLLTPRSYTPENRVHIHSGRGYMGAGFKPAQLGMDTKTIDMIMELFSVEITSAIKIIIEFNDYLKMS